MRLVYKHLDYLIKKFILSFILSFFFFKYQQTYIMQTLVTLCFTAYQLIGYPADYIAVVHPTSVVGPNTSNVKARLIIPVWQKIIDFVVRHRFTSWSRTLPGSAQYFLELLLIAARSTFWSHIAHLTAINHNKSHSIVIVRFFMLFSIVECILIQEIRWMVLSMHKQRWNLKQFALRQMSCIGIIFYFIIITYYFVYYYYMFHNYKNIKFY